MRVRKSTNKKFWPDLESKNKTIKVSVMYWNLVTLVMFAML